MLAGSKHLVTFPRIWVIALSKSDLLPELDVVGFHELLVEKVAGEMNELGTVLAGFVEAPGALSVGEDFVLLSSAKFDASKIEETERVGLDLILPIAAMLPFSRFARWAIAMRHGGKVAEQLLRGVTPVARLISGKTKLPGPLGVFAALLGPRATGFAAKLAEDKVRDINRNAKAKHDYISTMLTNFELDLDKAEKDQILIRSPK